MKKSKAKQKGCFNLLSAFAFTSTFLAGAFLLIWCLHQLNSGSAGLAVISLGFLAWLVLFPLLLIIRGNPPQTRFLPVLGYLIGLVVAAPASGFPLRLLMLVWGDRVGPVEVNTFSSILFFVLSRFLFKRLKRSV